MEFGRRYLGKRYTDSAAQQKQLNEIDSSFARLDFGNIGLGPPQNTCDFLLRASRSFAGLSH